MWIGRLRLWKQTWKLLRILQRAEWENWSVFNKIMFKLISKKVSQFNTVWYSYVYQYDN